ncbi:hypothetical protein EDM59_04490 [Brevibacillus nitrificans]|uniref:Uncharacterized protein n=1 Tax=Brevibacillus nitrificans TaxID=651560 RepID=A0A3M8DL82_9BACL|nr:hypothetical protein [Brevibacillus nitrificans]RNB88389.1 hypothetical protein EDM59_04490 [Brevibacillus nitrificans]
MRWGVVLSMTVLAVVLIGYEWPRLKKQPRKDKLVFLSLILIAWTLSLFDLPNIPGPTTMVQTLFRPFAILLE